MPEPASPPLMQVGHPLNMLAELPGWIERSVELGLSDNVRRALGESFWVNVRLLAEFFHCSKDKRDLRAVDFVPGWTVPTEDGVDLDRLHKVASKHVMHLASAERTETPLHRTPSEERERIRAVFFGLADKFATQLQGDERQLFDDYLRHARSLVTR